MMDELLDRKGQCCGGSKRNGFGRSIRIGIRDKPACQRLRKFLPRINIPKRRIAIVVKRCPPSVNRSMSLIL